MYADKRIRESRAKLYRCDGAVFDINRKAKGSGGYQALVRMAVVHRRTEDYKGLQTHPML